MRHLFGFLCVCALGLMPLVGCGDTSGPTTTCGAGTIEMDGECVTLVECGDGTVNVDNTCVPAEGATCGEGTEEVGGLCVPSEAACQNGTHLDPDTGACVPDFGLVCGAGTMVVEGECVPIGDACQPWEVWNPDAQECVLDWSVVCGAGTMEANGQCVCSNDPGPCGDYGQPCCIDDPACISVQICCMGASFPPEGECRYSCE